MAILRDGNGDRLLQISTANATVRRELAKLGLQQLVHMELQDFTAWYISNYTLPFASGQAIPMPLEAFDTWKAELDAPTP